MIIPIKIEDKEYNIIIEKDAIKNASKYIEFSSNTLIVYDDKINPIYLDFFKDSSKNIFFIKLNVSEQAKSILNYQKIITFLLENNFSKSDLLIAFGGGVIGDLVGFCASTYKRGCRFINIPTTTLSMIDSSIGGKTALNVNNVKNAIGSYYQPEKVIIDINVLSTLSKRQFNNGLVEGLKAGLIGDQSLFEIFKNQEYVKRLEEVIEKSIMVKKKIVEVDPYDNSIRKTLNFGHTIGHAIESIHMGEVYHGEAVACGMMYMLGNHLKESVFHILEKMNIDVNHKEDSEQIYKLILNDKKFNDNRISIIRVNEIEKAFIENVNMEEIYKILLK